MSERIIFPSDELVVGFPLEGQDVWLGIRRRTPWLGCLSGLGGNREPEDRNIFDIMRREARDEALIETDPAFMEKWGEFGVMREGKRPLVLHVILIHRFKGIPTTTEEMGPHLKFPVCNLPLGEMVPGDEKWVGHMLEKKEYVRGTIWRSADAEKLLGIEVHFSKTGFDSV